MSNKELWIGLFNVIPMEGNNELGVAKGAYVNIVLSAISEADFYEKIKSDLLIKKYYVTDAEDIELFRERSNNYLLSDELIELANWSMQTGEIGYDSFHTYETDESLM